MQTMTTDFSGTYDYPAEEARLVAESFRMYWDECGVCEYTQDEIAQKIIKERAHWVKVFGTDEQGQADLKRFAEVFNAVIYPLSKIEF